MKVLLIILFTYLSLFQKTVFILGIECPKFVCVCVMYILFVYFNQLLITGGLYSPICVLQLDNMYFEKIKFVLILLELNYIYYT